MKKRISAFLMCCIMMACMVCTMVLPAAAAETYRGSVGSSVNWFVSERVPYYVTKVRSVEGSVPDGTKYKLKDGMLHVTGTPIVGGTYNVTFKVKLEDPYSNQAPWNDSISCTFVIEGGRHEDYTLPTNYSTARVGEYSKFSFGMDSTGRITDWATRGEIPNGMGASMDYNGIYLKGTPTTSGVYEFKLKAYNSKYDCWVTQPVVLTVKGASIPTVTKNPTGENVEEGGRALFVARASSANSVTWYLTNGPVIYTAKEAPNYFPGLRTSGTSSEVLTLDNIPAELNGWFAQAKFTGTAGSVYSTQAYIGVKRISVDPAQITKQPEDVVMEKGEQATLSVFAMPSGNNSLAYRWFETNTPDTYSGTVIDGQEKDSLTLEYKEGVRYFYCQVWCYNEKANSEPVATRIVKVVGEAPIVPETEPATEPETKPAETEAPATNPTAAATVPTAPTEAAKPTETTVQKQDAPVTEEKQADHTVAIIAGGVAAVAMICGTAIAVTAMGRKGKYGRDD